VIKLVLLGGLVSIIISLFFFRWTGLSSWLGAASAGIVEESGKALTLLLVSGEPAIAGFSTDCCWARRWGPAFAVFESAVMRSDVGIARASRP